MHPIMKLKQSSCCYINTIHHSYLDLKTLEHLWLLTPDKSWGDKNIGETNVGPRVSQLVLLALRSVISDNCKTSWECSVNDGGDSWEDGVAIAEVNKRQPYGTLGAPDVCLRTEASCSISINVTWHRINQMLHWEDRGGRLPRHTG